MPSRNERAWEDHPKIPDGHYVSGLVYRDEEIFEDEKRRILCKVWRLACHESELPNRHDFRTLDHAGIPLLVTRGADGRVRTFVNTCSHRGAKIVNEQNGNAEKFTCFYHLWTYDTEGTCVDIPRPHGYAASGLRMEDCGLREVRTDVRLGLVFINLDDDCMPLDEFLGDALAPFEEVMGQGDLEVFHYHRAIVDANWKAWQETNLDLYHELMHVTLRQTQVAAGAMEARQMRTYRYGHGGVGGIKANYKNYKGWQGRDGSKTLPGLEANDFRFVAIFPAAAVMSRGTVMRIDTATPISAHRTLLEGRGLGIKGEPDEDRMMRINHHNQYWGPFGRNVPEDGYAAEACEKAFRGGAANYQIIAREENLTGQDDGMLRAFYAEWSRLMGRPANNPTNAPR